MRVAGAAISGSVGARQRGRIVAAGERPLAKIKAPRGTFDVLGEQARARALEARARAILEGAGYERIETPVFEATELFARGVGESTDIVSKEMFTLRGRRRALADAAPRGHRTGAAAPTSSTGCTSAVSR